MDSSSFENFVVQLESKILFRISWLSILGIKLLDTLLNMLFFFLLFAVLSIQTVKQTEII